MHHPDYVQYFPFPTIRDEQKRAIEFAIDAFLTQNKRFVILELGTGIGKSAIGIALSRYLAAHCGITKSRSKGEDGEYEDVVGSYILTTQKILQAQYVDDFGPTNKNLLRSLKSASNYQCSFYNDQSCGESKRLLRQMGEKLNNTEFAKCCKGNCPYTLDKQEFIEFPIGITNFSYFLVETMYAKQLHERSLLVIDECHNIEQELSKVVEVTFSEKFAKSILGCKVPKLDTPHAVFEWIKTSYKKSLVKHIDLISKQLKESFTSEGSPKLTELSRKFEMLDKHLCKVNRFIEVYTPDNWVLNFVKPPPDDARSGRKFEFKPIDVSSYGESMLYRFGSRVVLLSATIVDKETFCKSVGIDINDAAFLQIPSPFPVENRPIHYLGVGSMSKDNIEATLPKMIQVVKQLLELHKNDKGIIHCVSFKVAKAISDAIKSPRLLTHDSNNREEVINFHINSQDPTVLVSPSMTEGVNLADNASRFQILCKVPFPYLGDKVIQLRKNRIPNWYQCQTARTIIQAFGRSIRNADDHATSYILDSDWVRFYKSNSKMFPDEFSAALL